MKAGWEVKALGEVCSFENGDRGKNYPGRKAFVSEGVPFINAGHLTDDGIDWPNMNYIPLEHYQRIGSGKIQSGDILYCLRGSLGKFAHVDSDSLGAIASSLVIIRPKPSVLADYVGHYLASPLAHEMVEQYENGAAQPNLSGASLAKFQIPLPPLDEQKRIVEVLDAAFEGLSRARAHTETNLQNARELFESGVDEMFQSDLANWKSGTLGKLVGNVATGPFGSILHKSDYVEGQTPIVNPAHIVDGRIEPDSRKTISGEAKQRLKSYVLRKGDIVIGRRGDMGRCAVVGEKEDGWLCGTGSFFIRPNGNANSDFVAHLLRSRTYIEKLESVAGGATMPNISNKDLAELEVELPTLQQQDSYLLKIEALRSDTNDLQSHYRAKLADLDALRQALLQKAFAGELT